MLNLTLYERRLLEERGTLTFAEALALTEVGPAQLPALFALSHQVRLAYCGDGVELESLISAKTGGCPEDCAFCSQSARFPSTAINRHPFLDVPQILAAAKSAAEAGATQFCVVAAIRGPDKRIMRQVREAVAAIQAETELKVDCSLGILTPEQAAELREMGVFRYNHNLETARGYFPKIVTTHTWEERAETCRLVKDAGMELCSGGIFGMGESWRQRIEFAFELRELAVDEVPLNFLNPRPGTPLGEQRLLEPLDALKICAIFRLLFPRQVLRYAGGRELVLRDLQAVGLLAGVNGLIVGNYLTTLGRSPDDDLRLLQDLQMPVRP